MSDIQAGDTAFCTVSGVTGVVVKQYYPTACEQQTMVVTPDGKKYHAPTRMWKLLIKKEK